ncbi:hypothetical protein [Anaeromassilibacillus senegalensis]|uniref:hypothetical protein n=1 Tax=Anaeromassilibacillus senegalensis TaxID=1673717 RepID=UPI000681B470|nr:hypothetical protein [Anaeromassilibacillus senegalensis]
MFVDRIVPLLVAMILVFADWVVPKAYSLWFSVISILIVNFMEFFPNWIQFLRAKGEHRPIEDRSFLKKFARNMIISAILIIGAFLIRYFRTL